MKEKQMTTEVMKCDCEKGGHHFHRCTECGDSTAGYKYEKKWVCYICIRNNNEESEVE
jgi:hypothetical protein